MISHLDFVGYCGLLIEGSQGFWSVKRFQSDRDFQELKQNRQVTLFIKTGDNPAPFNYRDRGVFSKMGWFVLLRGLLAGRYDH